jgi:hypothetical protein
MDNTGNETDNAPNTINTAENTFPNIVVGMMSPYPESKQKNGVHLFDISFERKVFIAG